MNTKASEKLNAMLGDLTLGRAIRAIRLCDEVKQGDFAELLHITQSYLSDIECGRREVSPQKASEFADLLGQSREQFIRLSIQDNLRRKGFYYTVEIRKAA